MAAAGNEDVAEGEDETPPPFNRVPVWYCSGGGLIGKRVLLNLATVTANENDTLAKLLRRHLPGTSPGQDSIDWSAPGYS